MNVLDILTYYYFCVLFPLYIKLNNHNYFIISLFIRIFLFNIHLIFIYFIN
jgi:hypothetical protein